MRSLRLYYQASPTVLHKASLFRAAARTYGFASKKRLARRQEGVGSGKPWKTKDKVGRPALLARPEAQRAVRDRIRRIFRAEPVGVVEEVVQARLEIWGEVPGGESMMSVVVSCMNDLFAPANGTEFYSQEQKS